MDGRPSDGSGAERSPAAGIGSGATASSDRAAVLQSILETAADAILVIDARGTVESFNAAAERVFGYAAAEVVGKNVNMLMPPPFRENHDQYLSDFLSTGAAKIIGIGREVIGVRKDGAYVPFDLAVSQVRLGDRTLFTGFLRDISARKRAEQALRDYATVLESSNSALKAAESDAAAASAMKSQFVANLSHEIRTPLTAIVGFSEQCLDEQLSDADRQDAARIIRSNSEYLLQLVNDLLDLAKIDAGKFAIELAPVPLLDALNNVESAMRPRLANKGVTFAVTYDGRIPRTLHTDAVRVRQILLNLVGNAIKFTEKGQVTLTVGVCDGESRKFLRFDVRDTGVGISSEAAATLFRPFSQGDGSTTRRFGGTGLGLSIVHRLAGMMGGTVELVETQQDQGSHFRVMLPIDDGDLADLIAPNEMKSATRAAPTLTPVQGEPLTIRVLVAEDGVDNQRLIRAILSQAGAEVVLAENGAIAVQEAIGAEEAGQPFDVVLMDMQMPVMDGYEATRVLRGQDYPRPILALTAHAMIGDREKCIEAGCDDYLTKPIDRRKLVETLRRFVPASVAG